MTFPNARRLLKGGVSLSTLKLLAMQAAMSHPSWRPIVGALIQPFVHKGEVTVRYRCYGRHYTAFVRLNEMSSDVFTVKELAAADNVYCLDPGFDPDLIVDGGGNIGLFAMLAAALYPSAKIVVCEPAPRSLNQLEKHLRLNQIDADILPVCLGGTRRAIPFYVREAIASSFDPDKPYESVVNVDVLTLCDVLRGRDAEKILIKLDIEGMELEVLEAFVPGETRPVCVVGELHGRKTNANRLREILDASGWSLVFRDSSETDSIFEARSPAARFAPPDNPTSEPHPSGLVSG
jgi:FkbM family methyltransferase